MWKKNRSNQQAFTILELLIATTVFSVILLLITSGIIQIGRNYYKGVIQSRTQETARAIIDEISRGIQFSGEKVVPTDSVPTTGTYSHTPGGTNAFCVNGVGYTYVLDRQLIASPASGDHVPKTLISYPASCSGFTATLVSAATGRELLAQGMRLLDLNVVPPLPGAPEGVYTIKVTIATGERELFDPPAPPFTNFSTSCKSGAGKEFCAISTLSATVQKRVK